ncbi:5'-nucleotidase SurE [Alsobacter metallidurans]|uniref:5'-nucleotidase n=1 Tax=Alsobacter metallidurans TaxID=340221 RepID=A0A917MHD6_9HYPH|nr:5'/3'-nucleotidase SurE [Alsobacter metallidurans]GGH16283.1 5'-nucleotidase SurE [Alsobacter metallidurans]
MRILLCNDDGYGSPGLEALIAAAGTLSTDIWVVAPDGKRTAGSHALTLGRPLHLTERAPQRFSCTGTPADSVAVAMSHLFAAAGRPDLVLSGVNDSRNVGEDMMYSGTIGIAREAAFWGLPAIAFSSDGAPDLTAAGRAWIAGLIRRLFESRAAWASPGHWLSFNLPANLPAPFKPVERIGSNKIGVRCDVVEQGGPTTTLIMPRGRQRTSEPGDENDLLSQGFAIYALQSWRAASVKSAELAAVIG